MKATDGSAQRRINASRWGLALVAAMTMASAGVWASHEAIARQQERLATQPKAVPDNSSVSREARKTYSDFWKKLPREKADALEQELNTLEGRQRRGESVDRELEPLRREYPGLFQMSTTLQSARWLVATGTGGTTAATCTGLGWIGRNGRLRCLGRLTTG